MKSELFIITHARSDTGEILRTKKGKAYRLAPTLEEAKLLSNTLVAMTKGSECQVSTISGTLVGSVFSPL